MQIRDRVKLLIDKLEFDLKDEDELIFILKRRLTKKEFKVLKAEALDEDIKDLKERLNLDDTRFMSIKESIKKKLNSSKIKDEIYSKKSN